MNLPDNETRKYAEWVLEQLREVYGEPTWRNPLPPLDEVISTILSQNTNDLNRDKAFTNLRQRFASWEAVLVASIGEVEDAIRPAGLAPQKAPRIQQLLQRLMHEHGKLDLSFLADFSVEEARKYLLGYNGIGPKTAAIVMLFSLGKAAFPVDTHIYRVTGRLGLRPLNLTADAAHPFLERVFAPESYYTGHLNLIRLGREICQSRTPRCGECPLKSRCPSVDLHRKGN